VITVAVRVHPGASRGAVALVGDGSLDVRVQARALEGRANEAVVEALAERLGLRRREVRIVAGMRARQKRVEVDLASHAELARRLGAADLGSAADGVGADVGAGAPTAESADARKSGEHTDVRHSGDARLRSGGAG